MFKSGNCQKMSQLCSRSGERLTWPLSASCLATMLPLLPEARKTKPKVARTPSKHAGPPCRADRAEAAACGLVVHALPSVHR